MPRPVTHPATNTDRWTKAAVKRVVRPILGPNARVWSTVGRVYVGLEVRGRRVVIAAGKTWAELIDGAMLKPLAAVERARESGEIQGLIAGRVEVADTSPSVGAGVNVDADTSPSVGAESADTSGAVAATLPELRPF